MIKIALTKLGLEIRRNIPLFLVYAVCFYSLMPFVVIIIFLQLFSESPEKLLVFRSGNTEVMETAMANFLTQYSSSFVCGIAVVTLVLIGLVAARLPLDGIEGAQIAEPVPQEVVLPPKRKIRRA